MSGLILTMHMAVLVVWFGFGFFSLVLFVPCSWSLDGSELNIAQSLLTVVYLI